MKLFEVCIAIVTIVVCYTTKILSIKYKKKLRQVFPGLCFWEILTVRYSGQPNVQGFLAELKTKKKFPDSWRAFYGDCSGFIFLILERWSEWNWSGWWNSNWFNATKTNQHWQMGIIDSRRDTSGQVRIFQLVFFQFILAGSRLNSLKIRKTKIFENFL